VRLAIANRALPGGLAISGNAGSPFELDAALGIKRVNRHADRRRDAMLVFARPNSLAEYRKHQLTEMVNHPSKTADQTRAERTGPQIAQGTRQGGRFHEFNACRMRSSPTARPDSSFVLDIQPIQKEQGVALP
jgi:hypothetical protein